MFLHMAMDSLVPLLRPTASYLHMCSATQKCTCSVSRAPRHVMCAVLHMCKPCGTLAHTCRDAPDVQNDMHTLRFLGGISDMRMHVHA